MNYELRYSNPIIIHTSSAQYTNSIKARNPDRLCLSGLSFVKLIDKLEYVGSDEGVAPYVLIYQILIYWDDYSVYIIIYQF